MQMQRIAMRRACSRACYASSLVELVSRHAGSTVASHTTAAPPLAVLAGAEEHIAPGPDGQRVHAGSACTQRGQSCCSAGALLPPQRGAGRPGTCLGCGARAVPPA